MRLPVPDSSATVLTSVPAATECQSARLKICNRPDFACESRSVCYTSTTRHPLEEAPRSAATDADVVFACMKAEHYPKLIPDEIWVLRSLFLARATHMRCRTQNACRRSRSCLLVCEMIMSCSQQPACLPCRRSRARRRLLARRRPPPWAPAQPPTPPPSSTRGPRARRARASRGRSAFANAAAILFPVFLLRCRQAARGAHVQEEPMPAVTDGQCRVSLCSRPCGIVGIVLPPPSSTHGSPRAATAHYSRAALASLHAILPCATPRFLLSGARAILHWRRPDTLYLGGLPE